MTKMKNKSESFSSYAAAGVDTAKKERALEQLLYWVNKTLGFRKGGGSVELPSGYFANVLDIGHGTGLAISTDGVGTKVLVAQMANKYDTIGIDCVAMNVNDVLCVGAEPIAMVDYLAVEEPIPDLLEQIGKGLYEGARRAEISICGGEVAQLKEIVKGAKPRYAFDIAGTCVGLVPLDKVIVGQDITRNDVVIGLRSSGIHSNGLTLARRVFFDSAGFAPDRYLPELEKTLAEELLEPTRIYVPEIKDMLRSGVEVKALAHVTGDGFFNLTRVKSEVGYIVDFLPEPPSIFRLIQEYGGISDEEMYRVYNMGIGFCVVTPEKHVLEAIDIAKKYGVEAYRIGYTIPDSERKVLIEPKHLVGKGGRFSKV